MYFVDILLFKLSYFLCGNLDLALVHLHAVANIFDCCVLRFVAKQLCSYIMVLVYLI
jgi:hypothetical protein